MTSTSVHLPLVSLMENRGVTTAFDSKMVNCLAEKTSSGYMADKRPGLSLQFQGNTGCGQGLVNFLDNIYSVSGDILNISSALNTAFAKTTSVAGWSARTGMVGIGFLGQLWAIGGQDSSGIAQSDVYKSGDGISWTQVTANAPFGARTFASAIIFGSQLFLCGGSSSGVFYKDVWSTSDGLTWTQVNPAAWPARDSFGLCSFGGKLWVAGGNAGGGLNYNDVWSSVDGTTWIQVTASAPWSERSRFGFAGFNNQLIVLGGTYNPQLQGAGSDLWTSVDGKSWVRNSSNPFGQAATSVFNQVAWQSLGLEYSIPPAVSFSGGGGTGVAAFLMNQSEEEDGADFDDSIYRLSFTNTGSGYTSAPSISFTAGEGIVPVAHTFLNGNGVVGDKRGTFVQSGSILYFFATLNAGLSTSTDELWQSTDGTTWTLLVSGPAFTPRDSTAFFFGSFWILSGNSGASYFQDVWKSSLGASNQLALTPTITCLPMSFSQTSKTLTNPLLFFKSNTDAYTYNANLNLLTKVTNINYPTTTVPGIVYLDTYFFVMDPAGKIWNSALNDPSTWTALGFIPMQGEPNGGVAIGKVANYLVAFGVWSTQFFYDAAVAAPASPLQVNDTLTSLIGCASGNSVVQMQSSIVWMGQNRSEGRGIFIIENLVPKKISTPYIDRLLEDDSLSDVRAFTTGSKGHSLYVLTLINTNLTLVYDFSSSNWSVWTSRSNRASTVISSLTSDPYGLVTLVSAAHGCQDGDPVVITGASVVGYNGSFNVNVIDSNTLTYQLPASLPANPGTAVLTATTEQYFIGRGACGTGGEYLILHETNGGVYMLDSLNYTDFGNPIDVRTRTAVWDGGTNSYKTFPNISLIGDINQSSCLLRYTNDDYNTYSPFRQINMAISRQHLSRGGRARRRAYELRHTAATALRVSSLEASIEVGEF